MRVLNCKLAGKIAKAGRESADGGSELVPDWIDIDATNFVDYIYGGTTQWAEGTDYDGCSFLSVEL